jgi:hypothetical protein
LGNPTTGGMTGYRAAGQGNLRRRGGGDMTDDEIFTAATGQGLVVSTGILGDLVLPEGTFDPDRADENLTLPRQTGPIRHFAMEMGFPTCGTPLPWTYHAPSKGRRSQDRPQRGAD